MFTHSTNVQNMFTHSTNVQKVHVVKKCLRILKKSLPVSNDVHIFQKMNDIFKHGSHFLKLFMFSKIFGIHKV